jgi:hypothetical protein
MRRAACSQAFVKLQPFSPEQRGFLRKIGLGVAEARLYDAVGGQLPVRIPRVWHAACDAADGSFVMALEDLAASHCRFPTPADDDVLGVATSLMDELVLLHAGYRGAELSWLTPPDGMRRKPTDGELAARRTHLIQLARPVRRRAGAGVRDVAYFLCNSLPVETLRAEQDSLLARYRGALAASGWTLNAQTAGDQYRLFSIYSWIAAVSAAAMGSQWQPVEVIRPALISTTAAIEDLDVMPTSPQTCRPGPCPARKPPPPRHPIRPPADPAARKYEGSPRLSFSGSTHGPPATPIQDASI